MVVLRCFNEVLYPRLEKRGYSEKKVQENVECEIMCVVAEDARESYREEVSVSPAPDDIDPFLLSLPISSSRRAALGCFVLCRCVALSCTVVVCCIVWQCVSFHFVDCKMSCSFLFKGLA